MKHTIYFIIIFICLSVRMVGQPSVRVNTPEQVLGTILWKTPVTVKYMLTNTGNEWLYIEKVVPSCACTLAGWSREGIAPKKSGEVNVTYDAKQLGHFYKDVAVYTNASSEPLYLTFRGEVAKELVEDPSSFPNQIGSIRLDHTSIEFDDVNVGDKPTIEIKVMNGSSEVYTPVLMHLPSYLSVEMMPEKIAKNRVGKIKVTLDSEKLPKLGLTTASVYLARFPGDTVGEENELPVSVINLPDFSHLTEAEKQHPPRITLSTSEVEIGAMQETEVKKTKMEILNSGQSNLVIQDLQVFNSAVGVQLNKRVLAPGKKVKLKISVYGNSLKKIKNAPRVLMITNDPEHPKVIIKVKASLKQ